MKKILFALLGTLSGVVLLLSYRTSTEAVASDATGATGNEPQASSDPSSGQTGAGSSSPESSSSSSSSGASSGSSSSGLKDGTYTGAVTQTRFGPVVVEITVSGGRITEATATEYPDSNGRDQRINAYAVPRLESATVSAQSADIDMVSGATFTSEGYVGSLQDAIDQATS